MTDMRVDCQIEVPPEHKVGSFADAFRVLTNPEGDCVLDFLTLSKCRKLAFVVARVRVEKEFLESIRDRLEATLSEIQGPDFSGISPEQIEQMWYVSDQIDPEIIPDEGALPVRWFIYPEGEVD